MVNQKRHGLIDKSQKDRHRNHKNIHRVKCQDNHRLKRMQTAVKYQSSPRATIMQSKSKKQQELSEATILTRMGEEVSSEVAMVLTTITMMMFAKTIISKVIPQHEPLAQLLQ